MNFGGLGLNLGLQGLSALITVYAWKIIVGAIVLIIGLSVIKWIVKLISKRFEKSKVDTSLRSFLLSIIKITLQVVLVITVASMIGFQTTSFVAILGSAGLAVGLALQGSLSNFAGGVLILLLKPFKIGDYIEGAGHSGTVEDIQVFYTILKSPDNKKITIPNSELSNSSTVNYSANPTRRVDFVFGVGYEDDIFKVKDVLKRLVDANDLILKDPEPMIVLGEHGGSSVNFFVRVWCKNEDYFKIYFDLLEKVKLEFDKEGINIPYPQMDVHLVNNQ